MIVGGAVLAASAWRRPSTGRVWAVLLGLACLGAGCVGYECLWSLSAALGRFQNASGGAADDAVDRASADSFPASDTPHQFRSLHR
jgi:hypothetical protein